jgi:hypothetical protein
MTEQLTRGGVAAVKTGDSTDPVILQVDVNLSTVTIRSPLGLAGLDAM